MPQVMEGHHGHDRGREAISPRPRSRAGGHL